MKRRGCIDQLRNGRFRLRMSLHGKQETIGFYDARAEAERAAQVAIDVARDTEKDFEGLTLEDFGRKVLTRREVSGKVRDPGSDWSRWKTHIKPDVVARLAIRRVRTEHLYRWVRRLEDKGIATQTIRNCRTLVSVIFGEAVNEGIIHANPARELRVKGGKKPAGWTFLDPPEQLRLIGAFDADDRHLVAFAIGAGLRAGELVTLRLADVHLEGERPRVVVRFGSAPSLPTKTGRVRTVPLFGLALAAMRSWVACLPEFCPDNPHGLAFPRAGGGFRSEAHVLPWAVWSTGRSKAELGRRFRWHDLRHTCASSLVSGWWGRRWSLQEVKEMLGHTTITVTQRYAHLAESVLEVAGQGTGSGHSVTSSQLLIRPTPPLLEEGSPEKPGPLDAEPPSGFGPETYGLRKRSFSRKPREIEGGDGGLTGSEIATEAVSPWDLFPGDEPSPVLRVTREFLARAFAALHGGRPAVEVRP